MANWHADNSIKTTLDMARRFRQTASFQAFLHVIYSLPNLWFYFYVIMYSLKNLKGVISTEVTTGTMSQKCVEYRYRGEK